MNENIKSESRVLWVTNVASPYRRPVWEAFALTSELTVAILESDKRLLQEGRRGADWSIPSTTGYRTRQLGSRRLRHGESTYFFLTERLRIRGKFDAVLIGGWESPAYWQVLLAARLAGVRVVGFYESTSATNRFKSGPIAVARAWFFKHLDAVVVPGPAARAGLVEMGIPEGVIHTGFNAVDVRTFNQGAREARATNGGADSPGHRYVYVGQLIPRKNLVAMLKAFAAAMLGDDTLTIIGLGEQEKDLRALSGFLGIEHAVRFLGSVTNAELPSILAAHDTLILVSVEEVWGLVINEALACGLHVVVGETAGVAESVESMPGVFVCGTSQTQIQEAMVDSRNAWNGPIHHPPILHHTPEIFASIFTGALLEPNSAAKMPSDKGGPV